MSYLKRLTQEPLKELQAILRSNDTAKEMLLFQSGENNPQAIEDVRNYVELCSRASRQIVLHDMIEKRYALRPYGWPDDEVLLLLARMLVLGDISLMMDGALLTLDKVYEAVTAPAKRRKIVVIKRQTSPPEVVQKARTLGKDLFAEMGPDGEDALFSFLQGKLREWQANLSTYRPLAETGLCPGKEEITSGLTVINKLLADKDTFKFIERYNTLKSDLLDFADRYHDLQHFYDHQRPTWEKLRKANERFQLNRLELDRDGKTAPALKRMQEILSAPYPYALIKEADGLIATVSAVNSALLAERRNQAAERIDTHYGTLTKDMAAVNGDPALRTACLKPLETLKQRVELEESIAHITQAEVEAVKEFDNGMGRIVEFARKQAEKLGTEGGVATKPATFKTPKVIRPAELVKTTYLETQDDVEGFLDRLRQELQTAINKNERIQIR
jgi:hypothetical protein